MQWQVGNKAALFFAEREEVQQMPKDRGSEQGDVDGPLECSLALEMVAVETRLRFCRTASLWAGTRDPADAGRLQDEPHSRMQRIQSFQLVGLEQAHRS